EGRKKRGQARHPAEPVPFFSFASESDQTGGLALGGLIGLSTLLIHSFVDFGIHIPAIALLATVLSAHLCALADPEAVPFSGGGLDKKGTGMASCRASPLFVQSRSESMAPHSGQYSLRLFGLAPVGGAATILLLAFIL